MLSKTLSILIFGMAACACSSDSKPSSSSCDTDYSKLTQGAPTISFKNDVLPIFGLACASSTECHNINDQAPKAGLVLGVKGSYDPAAKWKYSFPPESGFTGDGGTAVDGGILDPVRDPHPLTQAVIDAVYANLIIDSATISSVKRVAPGDPTKSFLIDKLAGVQNHQSYSSQCQNQDPSKSVQGPCGDWMPQVGSGPFCSGQDHDRFAAVVQWVAQGAQNN